MTDSKFDQMLRQEKAPWLRSRGDAGGSFREFKAHLTKLFETDNEWRAAADENFIDTLFDKAGRMRRLKPIKTRDDDIQVHRDHMTVRDLYGHADFMMKQAKTKAERLRAERLMDVADAARERAGGNLDIKVRDLSDGVWPASDTRQ